VYFIEHLTKVFKAPGIGKNVLTPQKDSFQIQACLLQGMYPVLFTAVTITPRLNLFDDEQLLMRSGIKAATVLEESCLSEKKSLSKFLFI
jgi:hypothetical protein